MAVPAMGEGAAKPGRKRPAIQGMWPRGSWTPWPAPGSWGRIARGCPMVFRNGAPNGLLWLALQRGDLKHKLFDSSTGFRLPAPSVLSPDASLVAFERWPALPEPRRHGFAPRCPDLVVELASPSDEGPRVLTALRQKMDAYQRNGARVRWLLIPQERAVEVWGPPAGGWLRLAPRTTSPGVSEDPLEGD